MQIFFIIPDSLLQLANFCGSILYFFQHFLPSYSTHYLTIPISKKNVLSSYLSHPMAAYILVYLMIIDCKFIFL